MHIIVIFNYFKFHAYGEILKILRDVKKHIGTIIKLGDKYRYLLPRLWV